MVSCKCGTIACTGEKCNPVAYELELLKKEIKELKNDNARRTERTE